MHDIDKKIEELRRHRIKFMQMKLKYLVDIIESCKNEKERNQCSEKWKQFIEEERRLIGEENV